jgi:hypothetical protein
MNRAFQRTCGLFLLLAAHVVLYGQVSTDSQHAPNLYRPRGAVQEIKDTVRFNGQPGDTLTQFQKDSIDAREQYIQDSILARLQYIQDSILARERFVRDSIARRKRILDSVTYLRNELPKLLEASIRTAFEEIIIHKTPVRIMGDSMLTDYTFAYLIFGFNKPYIPWKTTINLSDHQAKVKIDTIKRQIISIKTPEFYHFYKYDKQKKIIQITSKSVLISKNNQKYFRSPLDSVFFDSKGRIVKIKKYSLYYLATANLRPGSLKYTDLAWVLQYQYNTSNEITHYEVVKFCERGTANKTPGQVCSIVNYAIAKQGQSYTVKRNNDPPNRYSDGTFVFEYTPDYTLKSVSFKNLSNQENWTTYVETNERGWVSRYVYKNNDKINKTLLVNYFDDPKAKNKFEIISCVFEDDGISYQQINNTTKKVRIRDKLTMQWSDWR